MTDMIPSPELLEGKVLAIVNENGRDWLKFDGIAVRRMLDGSVEVGLMHGGVIVCSMRSDPLFEGDVFNVTGLEGRTGVELVKE